MKILIDEQLPVKIKYRFADTNYDVHTVRDMNWTGQKNGDLIKLMRAENFAVLLTNDKNLYYQQKMAALKICIVNINSKTNRYQDVLELLGAVKETLKEVELHLLTNNNGYFIVWWTLGPPKVLFNILSTYV